MPTLEVEFKSRLGKANWQALASALEAALNGPVKSDITKYMTDIVGNWQHKPKFESKLTRNMIANGMELILHVYPSGENAEYWARVSRGTKRDKPITPVRAKYLVFPYRDKGQSYNPKTTAAVTWGGKGEKVGPIRRFVSVNNPGISARKFEEWIVKQYGKRYRDIMQQAFALGVAAAARR